MTLARRQTELVAALVAGAPVPRGFDAARVGAARRALLRKRAGEVARAWPMLAAAAGDQWPREFATWAAVAEAEQETTAVAEAEQETTAVAHAEQETTAVAHAEQKATAGRTPQGALRDGWDLARAWSAAGRLTGRAAEELARREAEWRYDGRSGPRRRRRPPWVR